MTEAPEDKKTSVQVVLDTGQTVEGTVARGRASAHHAGAETVYDVLNNEDRFLPVVLVSKALLKAATVETVFLNKRSIVEVYLEKRPAWLIEKICKRQRVLVRYDIGKETEGEILYVEFPPDRCEIREFLNAPNSFFHLYSGEKDHIINKAHVRQVVEKEAPRDGSN